MKAIDRRALDLTVRLVAAREILEEELNSSRRELLDFQVPDGRKYPPQPHPIGVNRRRLISPELFCFECQLDEIPELHLPLGSLRHTICSHHRAVRHDLPAPLEVFAFAARVFVHVALFLTETGSGSEILRNFILPASSFSSRPKMVS